MGFRVYGLGSRVDVKLRDVVSRLASEQAQAPYRRACLGIWSLPSHRRSWRRCRKSRPRMPASISE